MIDGLGQKRHSYRSQTAWPIRSAGIRGMIRDSVCFRPTQNEEEKLREWIVSWLLMASFAHLIQPFTAFVMFPVTLCHATNIHSHSVIDLEEKESGDVSI
jgi:hypothetical protein